MGNHSSGTAPPPGRCHRPRRRRTWRVPTRRTCGHTTSGRHRPRRGPPVPHTCQCARTHTCMHARHTNTHTCTQETVNLETEVVGDGASEAGDTVDEHPIAPPPPDVELHMPNLDELGDDELDVRARPCCPARPRPAPHNETHPPHATSSQWAVCGGWSDSMTCTQPHGPFLNTFHCFSYTGCSDHARLCPKMICGGGAGNAQRQPVRGLVPGAGPRRPTRVCG